MKKLITIGILFYSSMLNAQQAGSLDVSFGGGGRYVSSKNSKGGSFSKILPDGKILIVFMSNFINTSGLYESDLYFQRLNHNGTPDITFGSAGTGIIASGSIARSDGIYQTLKNVVLQPDGKYIIGRQDGSRLIYFNRINSDGTLDFTFSSNSISPQAGYDFITMDQANIQSNGKIVIGVLHYKNSGEVLTTILRLNSDGTLDLGFDGDGYAVFNPPYGDELSTTDIIFQPDGKILTLLSQCGGFCGNAYILRFNTNGSLDTGFGTSGYTYLTSAIYTTGNIYCSSICLKPDGKMVIGGGSTLAGGGPIRAILIGLRANGTFDNSFGTDGYLINNSGFYVESLKLQPDGKMVGAGSTFAFRFNADGSLDTAFDVDGYNNSLFDFEKKTIIQNDGKLLLIGITNNQTYFTLTRLHGVSNFNSNNGKMITQVGTSNEQANAVAIRPDGKIITAGYSFNAVNATSNNDFALVGYNADGSLDYTFGNNAIVKTDIATNSNDQIKAMTILSDGKILVVGESISGTNKNIVVAKYLADGSGLDPTFGVSGVRVITFATSPYNINVNAIAVHFSGLIFVGGSIVNGANTDFMLARFTSAGSYVGFVSTNIVTGFNVGYALAIQPDNKVILAGQSGGDFAVVRYNINATLDNTFGTNGKVTATFGPTTFEEVHSVALQADGKIVVGGNTDFVGGLDDFAVMRFNPNGSLDNTFGSGGKALADINAGSGDLSSAMAIYPSGKIVVVGQSNYSTIGLCRFNTNGTLDTGFDGDGKMTIDIGYGIDQVKAITLQTDGKMILAGNYANGANDDFALLRVNGVNDFSVNNGRMTASLGLYDNQVSSMLVQTDGKIVLAGQTSASAVLGNSFDSSFGLIRFNTDGSLDNTFDGDGKVKTSILNIDDSNFALALQSDGKIIAAGSSFNGIDYDFSLVRYNTNGSLDGLFGTGGKKITAIGTLDDNILSLAIQPADGKIIAAGFTFSNTTNYDCALFRYNSDGTADNTFGISGKVISSIATTADYINAIALQNDGKIVAVGRVKVGSFYKILVLRYSTAGVLDNTFDADGILQITTSSLNDYGISVDIQTDGKIVLGGYTSNGTDNDFVIIRLNTDGTFDNTFNGNGKLIMPIGTGDDILTYIKILPNGKILATGSAYNGINNDAAIVRINSNGTLDTSFDFDGKYTTPIGSQNDRAYGVASTNSIVYTGGIYNANTNYDYFLQKLPLCAIETPVLVNSADNYPNVALPNPQIGKSITATNFVSTPSNVTYQVKEKIDFLPGFKAENVQLFKTDIVGCSY